MFERTALPDGPRVISARMPGMRSLSVAVYVMVGSRGEVREKSGLAHFMEHITFKGTRDLITTREVSDAIEGVGGNSNAATDREVTVYWVRLPVREAKLGVHVLSELTLRPRLRSADIAHEREIIVDEIRSYRDDPGAFIFNVWDEAYFGDSPLGWEIAGDEESVRSLSDTDIREFFAAAYQPSNMVVSLAGDISHADAVELVDRSFGRGNGAAQAYLPAPSSPVERMRLEHRQTAQAHVSLGVPGLPRDDADQWTLDLLNTVLGDGTSSRLFMKIREEDGLAYDVHSFQTDYADCGILQVYMGVDADDVVPAMHGVLAELSRLRDEPVPAAELERARNYTLGRLELRLEESRAMASFLGSQEAMHKRVMTMEEVIEALQAVTADDLQALAGRLFRDEVLCGAVIGPDLKSDNLEGALRLP
ncbi:MAG: pitrilysin family protein [Chloroflexota bacterium]|nr:pitrilysin family protein [Chloroflexota bacterium]